MAQCLRLPDIYLHLQQYLLGQGLARKEQVLLCRSRYLSQYYRIISERRYMVDGPFAGRVCQQLTGLDSRSTCCHVRSTRRSNARCSSWSSYTPGLSGGFSSTASFYWRFSLWSHRRSAIHGHLQHRGLGVHISWIRNAESMPYRAALCL